MFKKIINKLTKRTWKPSAKIESIIFEITNSSKEIREKVDIEDFVYFCKKLDVKPDLSSSPLGTFLTYYQYEPYVIFVRCEIEYNEAVKLLYKEFLK